MRKACRFLVLGLLLIACGEGGGDGTNPTYAVTYNGNGNTGGSVPVDTTKYEQGQSVSGLGNTGSLVKTNYSYSGWNTQANGSGATYTQGQAFTMGATNITLYAVWTTGPTYTVIYSGNGNTGGSVPVDSTNYVQGQSITGQGNTGSLVKTDYSFSGWNTQANGSGATYTQGQAFAMGATNITLYAKWTADPVVQIQPNQITILLPQNSPQTFTVSNVGPQATTMEYRVADDGALGGFLNVQNASGTLSGGTGATITVSVKPDFTGDWPLVGATLVLNVYTPTAANYIKIAVSVYIVAGHSVTYNGNGSVSGSVPVDTTNYTEGQTATVLGNTGTLAKTNYTFSGWDTQADGSGTTYTPGQTFTIGAENVSLYAMWTANPTYAISGTVTTATGTGQPGAFVSRDGPGGTTTTTGADGAYLFTGLANGSYTLWVNASTGAGGFSPSSKLVTVNNGDATGQDFASPLPILYGSFQTTGTGSEIGTGGCPSFTWDGSNPVIGVSPGMTIASIRNAMTTSILSANSRPGIPCVGTGDLQVQDATHWTLSTTCTRVPGCGAGGTAVATTYDEAVWENP